MFKGNIKMRQLYIFFLVRKRLRVIRLFQIVCRQVQVFQQIIRVFKSNQQSRQRKAHQHKGHKLIGGNRTSKKQIAANQQNKRKQEIGYNRIHTGGSRHFYLCFYICLANCVQRICHSGKVGACHVMGFKNFHPFDIL